MTKYLINSGNVRGHKEKAKKYFAEVLKNSGSKPKILLCFFANPREEWEQRFEKYKHDFPNYTPQNVSPCYQLAFPDKFNEQCKENDIIWIHGGDDHLLQYRLRQFDLPKTWERKVVAVSSASSDAVCNAFWTCDWRKCMDGLGLVPIKFIPHYKSDYGNDDPRGPIDWIKAHKELEEYGDKSLPIYALEEGDFVVFEE